MIVLDASVLIAHLDESDVHHSRAVTVLLESADQALGAGQLTIAEVLVGPARADRLDAARSAVELLEVREMPLGPDAPARLASLRAQTGLRLPDCCVLLAARQAGPDSTIATFDDGLAAAASQLEIPVAR